MGNKPSAIILTDGHLETTHGKTAHGMVLGGSRFNIMAVVDQKSVGDDAGSVIDGIKRDIPVFSEVSQALNNLPTKPEFCVVGVAPSGGLLTNTLLNEIKSAICNKINIVSGLHSLLNDHKEITNLAREHDVDLIDIRKPTPVSDLHMWTGKISEVKTPRIAVLGTDCAVGKRTTCHLLLELCRANNINAEMIYTGQTGWLQGLEFGFIFDATLNDFVSGEMEYAIINCVEKANPDLILIEGQASLRNPAGPCGAEMILSGGAKYVILQHAPGREYFITDAYKAHKVPSLQSEIDLIHYYGAEVIAVTLNVSEAKHHQIEDISPPVICPREDGVDVLLPVIKSILELNA